MLKILVVDDSIIMRNTVKKYITSLGHDVVAEAQTGVEAVSLCKKLNPDLLTMDITMPDMDGIEAVEKIRTFDKDVNIVMVTSHAQKEIVVQAIKAGARSYMLKPVSEDKLAVIIGDIFPEFKVSSEFDDEFLDD